MNELEQRLRNAAGPEGRSRAELQRLAGLEGAADQTVLRALRRLVAQGLLGAQGLTRNRLYALPGGPGPAEPVAGVPLSPGARECLALLDRPLAARPPVGYRRELLDEYVPQSTEWLDGATRERLAAIGKTYPFDDLRCPTAGRSAYLVAHAAEEQS